MEPRSYTPYRGRIRDTGRTLSLYARSSHHTQLYIPADPHTAQSPPQDGTPAHSRALTDRTAGCTEGPVMETGRGSR